MRLRYPAQKFVEVLPSPHLIPQLTMTSKDGVSKERIDYEKPFSNCNN